MRSAEVRAAPGPIPVAFTLDHLRSLDRAEPVTCCNALVDLD
jgi:hypothetical protein